jgi:hypothetical protein
VDSIPFAQLTFDMMFSNFLTSILWIGTGGFLISSMCHDKVWPWFWWKKVKAKADKVWPWSWWKKAKAKAETEADWRKLGCIQSIILIPLIFVITVIIFNCIKGTWP